jgi:hypothetical protein
MDAVALDLQTQLVRAMTPEEKIRRAAEMYLAAWELKAAWIRQQQPELSEAEVQDSVRALFRDAGA